MSMRYRLLTLLAMVFIAANTTAQTIVRPQLYVEASQNFIDYYTQGGFQEKLYLATDKPYYSAGDTIYFSCFVVNSIYFSQVTKSRFIYVELIDATGNVVKRIKVMGEGGRFNNAIAISPKITAGRYTLRAYTRWQINFDKDLLASRVIQIGNFIDDAVRTNVSYDFDGTGRVVASVEVTSATFAPLADRQIEYSLRINGRTTQHLTRTDEHGFFRFLFRPTNNSTDCVRINISANGRKLDRILQLPSFEDDFSVSFLPEGGNLVEGIPQIVAFRAVGADGYSTDIEGRIVDKSGNEVCSIATQHNGMGRFILNAKPNEQYTAIVENKSGKRRSYKLPQALSSGCVIYMQVSKERVLMRVTTTKDIPVSRYAAIVQSRGMLSFTIEDLSKVVQIPTSQLRSGVAQVTIVDKESLAVVAERLFFVRGNIATASLTTSVNTFKPRQKIDVNIKTHNSAEALTASDLIVSVTDMGVIKRDENGDNILSYMLLNSDLRGHIEKPTYYFENDDNTRTAHLDLVMLTHGWRRYNTADILTRRYPAKRYSTEEVQSISGSVFGSVGKARNPSVMIYRNGSDYQGIHPLNKSNRFHITGIDSPDTTRYFIQALNREGGSTRVRIKIDPLIYPLSPTLAREIYRKQPFSSIPDEFLNRAKQSYYDDGGTPVIDIEEVVITARRIETYDYSSSLNDFNTVDGDMTRFVSIFDALQRFRDLEIIGTQVRVRSRKNSFTQPIEVKQDSEGMVDIVDNTIEEEDPTPAVYVNGQQMDINSIDAYPMSEVVSVSYLNRAESMSAGVSSEYGAIILQVRDINAQQKYIINSLAEVTVPGYAPQVTFYNPDYSVTSDKSKRDNRTTLAWLPLLKSNEQGEANFSFWSADGDNDYRVIVEGITSQGELLHNEFVLRAK